MNTTATKKYGFGESFINAAGNVIIPEVEHARAEGFEDGYTKAKGELESEIAAMMTVLSVRINEVAEQQKRAFEFVTDSTLSVVKAIVQKIVPHYFAKTGDEEVKFFVDEVLKDLKQDGAMTIFVHQELQKAIEQQVKEYCPEIKINVKTEAEIERTDCRVTWDDGGIEQIKSKLLLEVEQALDRVLDNVPVKEIAEGEENV